eukprot:m.231445 g.231445  ORF g.231445 m.231445 type:complete len:391 (+) comp18365_c0_seq1:31-1203(+)
MSSCPKCSAVLPLGAKFCPSDGSATIIGGSGPTCKRCSQPVGQDHSFCQHCGSVVVDLEVPKSSPLPALEGAAMEFPDTSLWFMPAVPRVEAERMLVGESTGTFLVRSSTNSPGAYDLSVKGHDKVYHFLISYNGAQYRLNSSVLQPFFNSIEELVHYHFRSPINENLVLSRAVNAPLSRTASLPQSPPPEFTRASMLPTGPPRCICGADVTGSAFCKECGRRVTAAAPSPAASSHSKAAAGQASANGSAHASAPELAAQIRKQIEEAKTLLDLMPLAATIVHAEEQCLLNAREIKQIRGDYKAKRAFFAMGLPNTLWEADASANVCKHCSKGFSITRRRHHCRCCGLVLCNKCSSHSLFRGGLSLERLCSPCLKFLQDVSSGKVPAVPS